MNVIFLSFLSQDNINFVDNKAPHDQQNSKMALKTPASWYTHFIHSSKYNRIITPVIMLHKAPFIIGD